VTNRQRSVYERSRKRLTCGSCQSVIPSGSPIIRDLTKRAHHPECRRRAIRPHVDLANPERQFVSPFDGLGQPVEAPRCPGCGQHVTSEHWRESVTVFGTRWHGDCRRRQAGGRR